MFHIESDPSHKVLTMSFSGHVKAREMQSCLEEALDLLRLMKRGFQLVTDLTHLERMDPTCSIPIGKMMDMCSKSGVGLIVRVIPNPKTDLGYSLMSVFHYKRTVRTVTVETLAAAMESLDG